MTIYRISILFLLFPAIIHAQEKLTLQQAIETGMKNNYAITIAQNNAEIAKNNNTVGNAGMLPQVTTAGTYTKNNNSTHQEYFNGNIRDADNAKSWSFSSNVMLNWTLFDGMAMFIEKDQYENRQKRGEYELRNTVENTVAEIIVTYYSIVIQKRSIQSLKQGMEFSKQRLDIARAKYKLGSVSELDCLQAEVDYNTDSAAWLSETASLLNSKAALNVFLSREATVDFNIEDTLPLNRNLFYNDLLTAADSANSLVRLAGKNYELSVLNYKLIHSPMYPRVNLFTGYNFSESESQVGILQSSKNSGPTFGLGITYTLFNGFENRRNAEEAKIQMLTGDMQLKQATEALHAEMYNLFNQYKTALALIQLQETTLNTAQKNAHVALKRYHLGEISSMDLRQIQLNQLKIENLLFTTKLHVKKAETELLRLSGKLGF